MKKIKTKVIFFKRTGLHYDLENRNNQKIERCKISWLLFADDLVLLASSESGLQLALNGFLTACDIVKMKISTSKTKAQHLSRNLVQCSPQVGGVSLKQVENFKYLGTAFTSDERQDEE